MVTTTKPTHSGLDAPVTQADLVSLLGRTCRLLVDIDRTIAMARIRKTRVPIEVVVPDEVMASIAWETLVAHAEGEQRTTGRLAGIDEGQRRIIFPWGTVVSLVVRAD